MEFNQSRALASEVYLVEKWYEHDAPPTQRRNEIFNEFVKLGMRGRWHWHTKAESYKFADEDEKVLGCRDWRTRCIAKRLGQDLHRVMVSDTADPMKESDLEYRTGLGGDPDLVCVYEGNPFDVLPELVYSMTAFDVPDDVEEARRTQRDQRRWVSGVFWIVDRIVWVDEFGETIREQICVDQQEMQEADKAFDRFRPFESTWWTEATRVGKYAANDWWKTQ